MATKAQATAASTTAVRHCDHFINGEYVPSLSGAVFDSTNPATGAETDAKAAEVVMSANGGNRTVPTLVFTDGTALTNPTIEQVKAVNALRWIDDPTFGRVPMASIAGQPNDAWNNAAWTAVSRA